MDRLSIGSTFESLVRAFEFDNQITVLPVKPAHLDTFRYLPFHHKDPFDRMIIAQAISEDLTIISKDRSFREYSVALHW